MPRRIPATRRDGWTLDQYSAEAEKVTRAANRRRAKEALAVQAETRAATVAAMVDGNREGALGIYAHGLLHASLIDDGMPRDHQAAEAAALVKLDQPGDQR